MKIMHLCLSNYYIDNHGYQENLLPAFNLKDGHEVMILASTETFVNPHRLGYLKPGEYINEYGIRVKRIRYRKIMPHFIMKKLRAYPEVYKEIEEFAPDVILHHGMGGYEIRTVAEYKRNHPNVRFYADAHSSFHNSAKNFISRRLLHGVFYKSAIRSSLDAIDRVLCTSLETFDFLEAMYGIPREMMEFYPLGGVVIDGAEHYEKRSRVRKQLGLKEKDILFLHSGRLDSKKRTCELLEAFSKVKNNEFRLAIIGSFSSDTEEKAKRLIESDKRVLYLGWKSGSELINHLCACDMYLQPGTQSATMQNAICTGCPVMLYPYDSHRPYLKDNGFFVQTVEDMIDVFLKIESNPSIIEDMRVASYKVAYDILDYKKLAARLYR